MLSFIFYYIRNAQLNHYTKTLREKFNTGRRKEHFKQRTSEKEICELKFL